MNTISVGCNDLKVANEVINGLVREVSRLRAALNPVLECDTDFDICGAYEDGSSLDLVEAPYDAVRECQRIYNESEAV